MGDAHNVSYIATKAGTYEVENEVFFFEDLEEAQVFVEAKRMEHPGDEWFIAKGVSPPVVVP